MNLKVLKNKGGAIIAENPKTAFWTIVATAGTGIVGIFVYKYKKKYDREKATREKLVDAECNVLTTAARTACKMMEHACNHIPDVKGVREDLKATMDELKSLRDELGIVYKFNGDDESVTYGSDIVYHGRSSTDLFNHTHTDKSKWIVEGYMKVNMINFIVAGGGVGKSNLMTQIAFAVAKGIRPEFLPPESHNSVRLHVVYYRLEDFDDELEGKYGHGEVFKESGIEWFLPEDLPENNLAGFIRHLKSLAAKWPEDTLVCIDPATKLDGYKHADFIKGVEDAMRIAKAKITPLASIHLDEIEDWKYLSLNNIKGGDKALQLAGSVTALRRERTDENFRFLQCLKDPKGSPKPFGGKVLVCKSIEEKVDDNNKYLHYVYDSVKPEGHARPLKPKAEVRGKSTEACFEKPSAPNQKVTPEMEQTIKDMLNSGMRPKAIGKKLGLSDKTIRRHKKQWDI